MIWGTEQRVDQRTIELVIQTGQTDGVVLEPDERHTLLLARIVALLEELVSSADSAAYEP